MLERRVRSCIRAFEKLAPLVWKLTCPVLRGQWGRKAPALPDFDFLTLVAAYVVA